MSTDRLKAHVVENLAIRAKLVIAASDQRSVSSRLPAYMLQSLTDEVRDSRASRARMQRTVDALCACGQTGCEETVTRRTLLSLLEDES